MYEITLNIDPDVPGDENNEAAEAAAAAAAEQQDEPSDEDRAIAAFDEGAGIEVEDDEDGAGEGDGDGSEGVDGDGGDPDAGNPEETDEQKAERERAESEAAEKAAVDKDVADLGLKGKAEERFRDLTSRLSAATKELEKYGGVEGLQRLERDAEDQRMWDQQLHSIGCTPEQFGQAIGYIAAINSNDPVILKQAHDNMVKEVQLLAERLGLESAGYDPLDAHQDLKDKVESGVLDREDALETARLRAQVKAREEGARKQQGADAAEQEVRDGVLSLQQLGHQLKGRDGAELFESVMQVIAPSLSSLQGKVSPSQWKDEAERLYEVAKSAMGSRPPAARPRVGGKQPMRQSHAVRHAPAVTKEHTDPMAAFDAGVEEVRARGA